MKTFLFLFLNILFLQVEESYCQSGGAITTRFTSRHFTSADGLPQIQVTYLFNDSKGFLWVGTKFGVARWNGKEFKVFTPKEGTVGKQVTTIAELPNGAIVVGWMSKSLNIIIGDHIESISTPAEWNIISVSSISAFGDKGFLIGINGFREVKPVYGSLMAYYDLASHSFKKEYWYKENWIGRITSDGNIALGSLGPGELMPRTVRLYHLDSLLDKFTSTTPLGYINTNAAPKGIYYTTTNKVQRIDISSNQIQSSNVSFFRKDTTTALSGYTFCEYKPGSSVYYDGKGNLNISEENSVVIVDQLPSCNVLLTDTDGNIWAGTENGLYCYFMAGIQEMVFNKKGKAIDEVWSMAKARDGTYYYASFSKGFWQSKDNNLTWSSIPAIEKLLVPDYMKKGAFGSLGLSNGAVILSTTGGFYYLDKGKATVFDLYRKGAEVYSVMEDKSHQYVYINKWTYLFRLELKTLKLDTLLNNVDLKNKVILNLVQDDEGNPIITGGTVPYCYKNGQWGPFRNGPKVFGYTSLYDPAGNLWMGSAQKLTCITNDSVIEMKKFPARQEVLSMMLWANKWLIIGGGVDLIFFDWETYNLTGKEYYHRIDVSSGFTASEGGQNSFLMDSDSSVWWCCSDKILHFWPQRLLAFQNQLHSPLYYNIRTVGSDGKIVSIYDSSMTEKRTLPLGFRRIEYSFGSAAFSNADNLMYRYRFSGSDSAWVIVEGQQTAVFTDLKPGDYGFEIQSSNNGINWSAVIKAPLLTIPAYWYESTWIYILAGALLVGVILLLSWAFSKWKRKGIERQKQLNELQLKAIRSKALPHFTGNSFANIDFYIEKGDTENASRYLAILSRLHNITLADSDKPSRTIEDEVEYVKLYLQMEKLRFEHKLEYVIEADPVIDQQQQVPNMVLHTYAENALKHGLKHKEGSGLIVIKVTNQSGGVLLSVTDNGIGRDAAAKMNTAGTQQGLSILGKQIALYNQQNKEKIVQEVVDMKDEEGTVVGTRFAIFIPSNFKY